MATPFGGAHKRHGLIASCDSSIYNYGKDYYSYVWPRDGAYAVWPLIRVGIFDEAKQFFSFCRDIIHPDGYLMHKYQPDRAIGSTWHPLIHGKHNELAIQEDETAIVIYMLGEYFETSKDTEFVQSLYAGARQLPRLPITAMYSLTTSVRSYARAFYCKTMARFSLITR
jgi:GH15 family glucan-1,4-alpha-glucosidase